MIFKYIRKPDGENLLIAREAYKYVDDIMVFLGWGSTEGRGKINRRIYRLYTVLVVIFSLYLPFLFAQSLMLTIDISHADTLFTTLEVFFNGPAYTIKSAIMLRNRWRVDKAKDMLDVMSERLVTYEERVRVHRLAVTCNYITLLYRYSENMRPLISIALFVQYTTASLVMASSLVHLVTFADMVSGVTTTIYMISCMFQTFPISYICEQIVEDCELLSRAIFHSNWIGAPTAYTSALKYFIHRTQQPIQFIAGGVFLICLNVNIQVAKFAFSLTTFVQQMSVFENFDR
ncbi:odorant receptor 98a isoform X2 [Drosophila mojavensis]|uniref:odorant receptor 98a isoform X2 n=1 Tax=Drosophila mojavensis TaxID=7230 RepID=UPI001CD16460|nr:odorant receptor 98a isoform X2 [Drosophila mojavensis]